MSVVDFPRRDVRPTPELVAKATIDRALKDQPPERRRAILAALIREAESRG